MELMQMSVSHQPSQPSASGSVLATIANVLSKIVHASAAIFCWSYVLLIAAILLNVTLRYGFSNGLIIFEEIQWHLYAIGMMFGISYAEITNSQVRVDIIADRLRKRTVLTWEIIGSIFFILPFTFVVIYNAIPYVLSSYMINETSNSPLGLPFRWAIKAVIPISFIVFVCAVVSRLLNNIDALIKSRED
ncbi:MAG: TRAP-type mannitol/chloroaromatic compound transport system permease small subunit [Kiritimatiellia bacterium]|jgi:TRAP-type mannitol/chloroaromatic compound transport system permease small subunit